MVGGDLSSSSFGAAGAVGMTYLLDTDICSAHFRNDPNVTPRMIAHAGLLAISVVTLGELQTWASRRKASPRLQTTLDRFAADVMILDMTEPIARQFGFTRAVLLDSGTPVETADLQIAATALVHGLTLVTHNTRHYVNVPGLTLDDWSIP